jgi:hypothetical protein
MLTTPDQQTVIAERMPDIPLLHHVEPDGTLWATARRRILCRKAGVWQQAGNFPLALPRDLFGFSRPAQRALRVDKANLYVNRMGKIIGIRANHVYHIQPGTSPKPLFRIQGDSVLHGGIAEDPEGWVYFGEYFMNQGRGPVCVWRLSPDLSRWERAHTFPAGRIRHVHGVYRDPYDPAALWLTTGDNPGECYLFRSRDGLRSLERFGDGSQGWRAVRLFFTPNFVTWLTDSPHEPNVACQMPRGGGDRMTGQAVPASSWYGTTTQDGLHVAFTTVEPGPAIRINQSLVLLSGDAFRWKPVLSFQKDRWRPMKLFKYGVISCPSGSMSAEAVYISGEGLVGLDGVSARLSFRGEQG